jgi:hypothetical protein
MVMPGDATLQVQGFSKGFNSSRKVSAPVLDGAYVAQRLRHLRHASITIRIHLKDFAIDLEGIFKSVLGREHFIGFKVEARNVTKDLSDSAMAASESFLGNLKGLSQVAKTFVKLF